MSERKLFILGTASQVPTHNRNHNGYFLRWDSEGLLFDPGEGTQRQLTLKGIAVSQIKKIFISHFHGDHCLGLPGVIQRMSLDQVSHAVEIFYPASGQKFFENLKEASIYYFQVKLVPRPISESGIIFENDNYSITAQKLDHTAECFGFRLREKDSATFIPEKLKQYGLSGNILQQLKQKGKIKHQGKTIRLEQVSNPRPGQCFAFVLDTRFCPAALELATDADLLLADSTYLSDREEMAKEYGHLTAAQAARLAKQAGAKKLVLTHFSQIYVDTNSFAEEASTIFPDVIAASDGDVIPLPKRKRDLEK